MASAWSSPETSAADAGRSGPAVVLSRDSEAEWSGLWVGLLGVATLLMLLISFISVDMIRNLYEFREGGPAPGLVRAIAGIFGG